MTDIRKRQLVKSYFGTDTPLVICLDQSKPNTMNTSIGRCMCNMGEHILDDLNVKSYTFEGLSIFSGEYAAALINEQRNGIKEPPSAEYVSWRPNKKGK